ncbi:MAG: multidrug effflux MFS transporter [Actinomycetia bacterium]|nr:multidrug effflux MFS transporter [Actinomycetes bacterium]MCP4958541.1 multidrug effflux MFS transporter [Actinomycetes bacterium]
MIEGDSRIGRREFIPMIAAIMALTALSIDLMLPALDEMREAFGLGDASPEITQVITVFFFGLAVGQLLWGPLSDRFGRKPVLAASLFVYVVAAIGSALAPSLWLVLVGRFVWALGASGCRTIAVAVVRDVLEGDAMARAMSVIMAVFMVVPIFAPSLGSAIIAFLPWQATFWACALGGTAVWLWTTRLPETLAPEHRRPLELTTLLDGAKRVATTPMTVYATLASLFLQGVMTAWLATSELIIGEIFDRRSQFPFFFGGIALLFAAGALLNGWAVTRIGMRRVVRQIIFAPVIGAAVLVAISASADGKPNIWVFMPVLGLAMGTFTFLMPNLNTLSLEPMGDMAGLASSLTSAIRLAGGSFLGWIVASTIETSVTPFAVALLVLALLTAAAALPAIAQPSD